LSHTSSLNRFFFLKRVEPFISTVFFFYGARDQTESLVHTKQVFHHWANIPSLLFSLNIYDCHCSELFFPFYRWEKDKAQRSYVPYQFHRAQKNYR
jgi:hypothetical protein